MGQHTPEIKPSGASHLQRVSSQYKCPNTEGHASKTWACKRHFRQRCKLNLPMDTQSDWLTLALSGQQCHLLITSTWGSWTCNFTVLWTECILPLFWLSFHISQRHSQRINPSVTWEILPNKSNKNFKITKSTPKKYFLFISKICNYKENTYPGNE